MVYAVIDTNVLVSSLLTAHADSATVIIWNKITDGEIIPLYNYEILDEYSAVLSRPKFRFPAEKSKDNARGVAFQGHHAGPDKNGRDLS